jgi:hypothetical protein
MNTALMMARVNERLRPRAESAEEGGYDTQSKDATCEG